MSPLHTDRHGNPIVKHGRPAPNREDMLATEQRDFYKRVFIAALTGTAIVGGLSVQEVVKRAEQIAERATAACDMWKTR